MVWSIHSWRERLTLCSLEMVCGGWFKLVTH